VIVVFGSINTDLVVRVDRLPLQGETLGAGTFTIVPGGKGANQAVGVHRLGADVRLIGRIGDDELGRRAVALLGIDTTHVSTDPDEPTGVALITVAEDGGNTIVTAGGANHRVGDRELAALEHSLPQADFLLIQLEVGMHAVEGAVAMARAASVPVMLDPAPVATLGRSVLDGLDWITPNQTEAEALTGRTDAAQAARVLLDAGVANVVVTLGADGCLYNGELHIAAPKVDVVDTVASGDAFNAALAVALTEHRPIEEALRFATAAGAAAAMKPGAHPSLPAREDVDRLEFV
jgi:ribokinase